MPQQLQWMLALALTGILLFSTCQKEDLCNDPTNRSCPNYDPCFSVVPAVGGFSIIDSTVWTDSLFSIEVDTTLTFSQFYFRADNPNDMGSYEWRVGTDPRTFPGGILEISFRGYEGPVSVQLTITADDPENCLPSEQQAATSSDSFYVYDFNGFSARVWGTFAGHYQDTPEEQDTIRTIGLVENSLFNSQRLFDLRLPLDCNINDIGIPVGVGYAWFVSDFTFRNTRRRCRNLTVIGRLNKDNRDELTVDYWYDNDQGERIHEVFVGYRI